MINNLISSGFNYVSGQQTFRAVSFLSLVAASAYNIIEALLSLLTSLILASKLCNWANQTDEARDLLSSNKNYV
jgi:hypothetical protein